ncbi:MAG: nuclear transport factor 2 family protein [Candidatus Acidiferrales bacterium]
MKSLLPVFITAALLLACLASAGANSHRRNTSSQMGNLPNAKLTAELVAAEKEFWEAWKDKQPKRFAAAMADDAVFFGLYGVTGKAESVAEQRDSVKTCNVKSYDLTNPRVIPIDANAAILLYDAEQHAICGGQAVQPFMHGESVYARRNGRWINLLRSEVPAADHREQEH